MSTHAYAFKEDPKTMAKAVGRDLAISTKASVAICAHLRRRNLDRAKALLERVVAFREAVPFTRATNGLGHKAGMGPGRFPVKAASHILDVLRAAEANAHNKGLGDLRIVHICAHKGPKRYHFGRWRRRQMKRTHIEVVVQEIEGTRRAKKDKPKEGAPATPLPIKSGPASAAPGQPAPAKPALQPKADKPSTASAAKAAKPQKPRAPSPASKPRTP